MGAASIDPQQVLTRMNFGRVDGETDTRFENCFIGTEMLRQVLMPQHALVIGSKGAGKSAMCRLLCEDVDKVRPLLPKEFSNVYCIPAYGLQTEEYLSGIDVRELKPTSADDFRYFWLLYIGLKAASWLTQNANIRLHVEKCKDEKVKHAYTTIQRIVVDFGLTPGERGMFAKLKERMGLRQKPPESSATQKEGKNTSYDFKQKTGLSVIALLENIDIVLRDANSLGWIMLDKLDLLFIEDFERLKGAITGLIQLLVQYGNQFTNIHFKIFIRNDIYRQLHIVNKSHLITYSTEMKWRGPLLLKLLVSRAIIDPFVKSYCEDVLREKVDVTSVILNDDGYVKKVFYAIFEPTMHATGNPNNATPTHLWILKRLVDGLGNSFPREIIHLGNMAVEKQREMDRAEGKHMSSQLISPRALKEAFAKISSYRCDTYLYAEFPHLAKHFDVFRGSDSSTFHREELYMLFQPLMPNGDEAIRAVHDVGLLVPVGKNVDSCSEFKVPFLYRPGLGVTDRRTKPRQPQHHDKKSTSDNVADPEEVSKDPSAIYPQ